MKRIKLRTGGIKLSVIISTAVLLSVLLTLWINMGVGYRAEKNSLYETTLESNGMNADVMGKTTESLLVSMQKSIGSLADYVAEHDFTDQSLQDYLDYSLNAGHFFNSLIIVDKDGVVQATSPSALQLKGDTLRTSETREALQLQQPSISQPYVASTGRLIVLVSHPLTGVDGEYKGMVAGSVYLQEENIFNNILGQQLNNTNGTYFYVVDSSGYLIYHPDKTRIGDNVAGNAVVDRLMKGESGTGEVLNSQGILFLSGYASIPSTGWGVVTQTPVNEIIVTSRSLVLDMIIYSSPFILALVVLTFLMFRKLTNPLRQLALYAGAMNADGPLATPPSIGKWNFEANELNKTITFAFEAIRERAERLQHEAHTDALTGLTNRRTMDEIIGKWMAEMQPFSIVMMDIDRFKSVNDTYGHQKGDEVIKDLAAVLIATKKEGDYCCRYGGEEFILLLPGADAGEARTLAEKIRLAMEARSGPIGKPVTLSLGVSSYPCQAKKVEELLGQADAALYEAKRQGRNQTVVYGDKNPERTYSHSI